MTAQEMEKYNRDAVVKVDVNFNFFEIAAAMGFIAMIAANFLSFVPIDERTWREIGVGFPVAIASIIGLALVLKRQYFWSFFIAMFSAFFITHEVIICYDNKAVEMGKELGPEGWFRPVAMIFQDAMSPSYGAFWGIVGISVAIAAIIVGWIINIHRENQNLALESLADEDFSNDLSDDSENDEMDEAQEFEESEETEEFSEDDESTGNEDSDNFMNAEPEPEEPEENKED